ncbi:PREDICTED: uterine plasmin/trypsin inhibitor-like [Ceratotherium simum simum]|uniref:Uterine plasmin/trypsin inhibitor-like n=1 Tax=Ceratotherium simum simum TaxID=73337 RepID=A0ABM1CU15_CERSS|nr:PREDICTED: uterine plasmin/trypsin inhibitor-like [Ceratotherium simum simum]
MKMDRLCLFALLALLSILVAGTQGNKELSCILAVPPAFCLEPPYTGPCKARFPRYFFNATSRECKVFTYGGCRGKKNNFGDKEECLRTCRGNDPPPKSPRREEEKEEGKRVCRLQLVEQLIELCWAWKLHMFLVPTGAKSDT